MVLLREAREQTDADLVAACRGGDASAYDALIGRYKDRLFAVVVRYMGDREEALEVCQDACVRAWTGLDSFRGDAKFSTWLFGIALNLARNRFRDRSRKGRNKGTSLEALAEAAPGRFSQATSDGSLPSEGAMAKETEEALQAALNELDETLRATFVLRVMDGLSYQEIADVTSVPVGTVKSRLNAARKALRETLKANGVL